MVGTEIAGHILREHLGTGLLGETYRAESSDGSSRLLRIARKPDYVYLLKSGYRSRVNIDGTDCRGFESAEVQGDQAIVLAEFLDLQPLSDPLAKSKLPGAGSISYLMTEVTGIINTAHERGLVHGGLKPQNILLGDGRIVVTDFGFAELVRKLDREGFLQHMKPGEGEPGPLSPGAYLPPEQVDGSSIATPEGDVYALGVLLLALLTGDASVDQERIHGCLPKPLAQLISRAIAEQAERIPDAQELLAALEALDLEALAEELDAGSQETAAANPSPTPSPEVEPEATPQAVIDSEPSEDDSTDSEPAKSADERAGETHIESAFDIPPLVNTSATAMKEDKDADDPSEDKPKKSADERAGETHIESAFDIRPLTSSTQEGVPEPPLPAHASLSPPSPPPLDSVSSPPGELPDLPPLDDDDPFKDLENLTGQQPAAAQPTQTSSPRPTQRRTDQLPAWKPEPPDGDVVTPFRDDPSSSDSGEALQPLEGLDAPMPPAVHTPATAATPDDPFGALPDLPPLEDLPPLDAPGLPPLEPLGLPPLDASGLPPLDAPGLPPLDAPGLPPLDAPGLPPLDAPGLPPLDAPGLPPLDAPGLPPLDAPSSSPFDLPGLPPLDAPGLPPLDAPSSSPFDLPGLPPLDAPAPASPSNDPFAPFLPQEASPNPTDLPPLAPLPPAPPPPLGLPDGFPPSLNVSEERDGFFGEAGNDPFGRSDPQLEVVDPGAAAAAPLDPDLEPLDPAEATRMVEQETVRRRSGTLPAVPLDETLDSTVQKPLAQDSGVAPHLRKTTPSARAPAIGNGSGDCGLVISGLAGKKKEQAATIIAQLRNISQSDAMKVCGSQIVPVLKRVSRDEAERVQSLFKQANINSKITQRRR